MEKTIGACPVPAKKRPIHAPRVREAVFDDYRQIVALQVRNGLTTRSYEDWLALWKGNPVYEARSGNWPIGWVLETESGETVGTISNVPLGYSFRGRALVAATACSWAVDSRYRGYSMLILDRLMRQEFVDFQISTTVSANAEPGYRVFQWSKVPAGAWDTAAFWITGHRGFARHAVLAGAGPLAPVLSWPAAAGLLCWEALRPVGRRSTGGLPELELCASFDGRFDEFWEELQWQNREVLLGVRSRQALEWHFQSSLRLRRTWVLALSRNSRLVGYAIFDRLDNTARHLKRVRLVDLQCLREEAQGLRPLLEWMLRRCRQDGVHCLEITGGWLERPGLPRLAAPYHRRLPSWTFYYRANNPELSEPLGNPSTWSPSSFDGDASL